jgi:hypothetical protein
VAAFLRGAVDPQRGLDDVAFYFAVQYYQLLNRALAEVDGRHDGAALGAARALYLPRSTFAFRGGDGSDSSGCARGADAVAECVAGVLVRLRAAGVARYAVQFVDASACEGGAVIVHVHGALRGAAFAGAYADLFMLERAAGGNFCIAHQACALL